MKEALEQQGIDAVDQVNGFRGEIYLTYPTLLFRSLLPHSRLLHPHLLHPRLLDLVSQ